MIYTVQPGQLQVTRSFGNV